MITTIDLGIIFIVLSIIFAIVAGVISVPDNDVILSKEKVDCFDKFGNKIMGTTCLKEITSIGSPSLLTMLAFLMTVLGVTLLLFGILFE